MNLIEYAGNKLEAQLLHMENGTIQTINPEIYLQYMGTRPSVQHVVGKADGLFSLNDSCDMALEKERLKEHADCIRWSQIISLTREDAQRTGYDNWKSFATLIRAKAADIARIYNIDLNHLVVNAAFHDKDYHPHIHILFYSTDPREGYVKDMKRASEKLKSLFLNEIFRNDVAHLKELKTEQRKELDVQLEKSLKRLYCKEYTPPLKLPGMLADLSEDLQSIPGKLVYGYLPLEAKQKVNAILEYVLQEDKQLANIFASYCDTQERFVRQYADDPEKVQRRMAEFREKFFHPGKNDLTLFHNCIVKYAAPLSRSGLQESPEIDETVQKKYDDVAPENSAMGLSQEVPPPDDANPPGDTREASPDWEPSSASGTPDTDYILPGEQPPQSEIAAGDENLVEHLIADARAGKDYAYFKLGKMLEKGELVEQDYKLALDMFVEAAEKGNPYAAYRAARMYRNGIGSPKSQFMTDQFFFTAFKAFEEMAALKPGIADQCLYRMGMMAMRGEGLPIDLPAAARYFADSAYYGNHQAEYRLGTLYLKGGEGLDRDPDKAVECLRKAVVGGDPDASFVLGKMLMDGTDIPRDVSFARSLLEAAAGSGNHRAEYALAKIYLATGDSHSVERAVVLLTKSAESKNPFAQYALSRLYLDGKSVAQDIPKACELLTASALQDNDFAQYKLGCLYLDGNLVAQDIENGLQLLTNSAELGNQYAQYRLGCIYLAGDNLNRDLDRALDLLQTSAGQGNAYAAYRLGRIYTDEKEIPANPNLAARYFSTAFNGFMAMETAQPDAQTEFRLGSMLLKGEGCVPDTGPAVSALNLSASKGNQFAQYALGKLYLFGKDVPKDKVAAVKWLAASANQGSEYAKRLLASIEANRSRNIAYAATMMIREIAYGLANETRTNDRLYGEPNNAFHRAQTRRKFRRITPQQQPQRNIADDISY